MKLNFKNPAHLKIHLLSEGIRLSPSFFRNFTNEYQGSFYHYSKDNTFKGNYPHHMVLPLNTVCAINYDEKSPWLLSYKKGNFEISYKGETITKVNFPKKYEYLEQRIDKKSLIKDIAFLTTPNSLNIMINKSCYFWDIGNPCKFCGFNPTRQIMKDKNLVTPLRVKKLIKIIGEKDTRINQVYFVGGTYKDFDEGFREIIRLVAAAKKVIPKGWDIIVTNFPPRNLSLIKELKEVGADRVSFAIEMANPELFKRICPGKQKSYGHNNFIKAAIKATKYFPDATYLSIIQGFDKKEELIAFMWKMFKNYRIMPTMNIYYNSPYSLLNNKKKRPSVRYLYEVSKAHQEIFVKSNIRLFSYGADRHCLDWEAFRQMIF